MSIKRFEENPLIRPVDVKASMEGYEVICAFNAAVTEYEQEVLMLLRVAERPINPTPDTKVLVPMLSEDTLKLQIREFSVSEPDIDLSDSRLVVFPDTLYLTSISHLRVARSRDGVHFTIDEKPALFPEREYERYGIEDPRITRLGDTCYIVYKGVSSTGITQCLASTKDFVSYVRHGIIFAPENMDAMIFPEKINGRYAALHRPRPKMLGEANMWLAWSDDLLCWGQHEFLLGVSAGTWEAGRIGGGAVPLRVEEGWLEIYHAATADDHYCLGAMLLDHDDPSKVLKKSTEPILAPEAPYEVHGFKDNVVFTCGALRRQEELIVYYGAADESMCAVTMDIGKIMKSMSEDWK